MSDKRKGLNAVRAAMMQVIRHERRTCEGRPLLEAAAGGAEGKDRDRYLHAVAACLFWRPADGHEPLKRSRGGSITDPTNTQHLCRPCHEFTEAEVALSERAGLLLPSRPVDRILWRRP